MTGSVEIECTNSQTITVTSPTVSPLKLDAGTTIDEYAISGANSMIFTATSSSGAYCTIDSAVISNSDLNIIYYIGDTSTYYVYPEASGPQQPKDYDFTITFTDKGGSTVTT